MTKTIKHRAELVSQVIIPKARIAFDHIFDTDLVKRPRGDLYRADLMTSNVIDGDNGITKLMRELRKAERRSKLAPLYNSTVIR